MTEQPPMYDAYRNCERSCTHDLARGVLTSDLDHDGPCADYATDWMNGNALSGAAARVRDWQAQQ